jgi:hypothetical protein
MSDLTTRLAALLRLHAAAFDERQGDNARLGEQFRRDMELLVARYCRHAVNTALDELPDKAWPSVSLH